MKDVFWIIPSNLGLDEKLKSMPPSFKYKIDYFYHIIDCICRGSDYEDLDNNAAFVNLSAKQMQAFNHEYKQYIDYLLEIGLISTDRHWVVGKKSMGYKLNPFLGYDASMIQVRIKDRICRKKMFSQARLNNKRANADFPALTKWFNSSLQIDVKGATEEIDKLFPRPTGGIRGVRRYFRGKKNKPDAGSKRLKAQYAIQRFASKDFYFHIDDNVGRFHSNLTNIKRELRHFITYRGQKLVNIDIKSAQPLISTLLLSKEFYQKFEAHLSIQSFPTIFNTLQLQLSKSSSLSSYIMLVECLENIDNQFFKKYTNLVKSGSFYEVLSELVYPGKKISKAEVKLNVYRVFFSKNRSHNPFKTRFKKLFPEVYNVFALYKRKDHTCLSRLLQSIESFVMIQSVAKRISRERPELPIFTIHDSIATTIGNEEYVKSIVKEEAYRITGLRVKLGMEYWG